MHVANGILLCALAGTAFAEATPAWRDPSALDALDADLAAIASGLGSTGPIDCAAYARIAPHVAALPARIAAVHAARERLIDQVQTGWLAQHSSELERRITDVVVRLRGDKRCPAILADDAAHLAARAIVALAERPAAALSRRAVADAVATTPGTCAAELRENFANAALLASRLWKPTPLEALAVSVDDTEEMRLIDAAPVTCGGSFGGKPRVSGAGLGEL